MISNLTSQYEQNGTGTQADRKYKTKRQSVRAVTDAKDKDTDNSKNNKVIRAAAHKNTNIRKSCHVQV